MLGQSKKELQRENLAMKVATDSLRRSLAEARREWKKCKDHSSLNEEELSKQLQVDKMALEEMKGKLGIVKSELLELKDTLRLTKAACELLQADMAAKSQIDFALETKATNLQNILNDSLASWIGPQVSLLRYKDKVSLTLGDSILFGGGAFVNGSGQKLMTALVKTIAPFDNIKLVVNAWGRNSISSRNALSESFRRALSVAMLLDLYKWPSDRILTVGQGKWESGDSKSKGPIRIDFLPIDDLRF